MLLWEAMRRFKFLKKCHFTYYFRLILHSKVSVSIGLYFYDVYIYIHNIIAKQNCTQITYFWNGNNKCKVIRGVKNGYKISQNIRCNPLMHNHEKWANIL